MDGDRVTSVDQPQETSQGASISEDDMQAMVELYKKCPMLWNAFKDVIHVAGLLTATTADEETVQGLLKVSNYHYTYDQESADLSNFSAFAGFVEKSVIFSRQIMREKRKSYITDFQRSENGKFPDLETACLYLMRSIILNCTYYSSECSVRLIRTGFLQDLVEDLKHVEHLSVEALVRDKVFLYSVGTIANCCAYPELLASVRQLDIVPHITPFLTKQGDSHLIRYIALGLLACVTDEDQLDLLTLDAPLLQYLLNCLQVAVETNQRQAIPENAEVREVLKFFYLWAQNDSNKCLMVAQGTVQTVLPVLDPSKKRSAEEKQHTVALIDRLTEDPINLHMCQNYQELAKALKDLEQDGISDQTKEKVGVLLGKLEHGHINDRDDLTLSFPHLAELLADQSNMLGILRMGLVEFVLEELREVTRGGSRPTAPAVRDSSHGQEASGPQWMALRALTELSSDDGYRREIAARGGLAMVRAVLGSGNSEEKMEAVTAIRELAKAPETRPVIQIDTDLISTLESVKQRADNEDLAQQADSALQTLSQ